MDPSGSGSTPPLPPNEGASLVQRRRRSSTLSKLVIPDVEVTGTGEPSLRVDETIAETRELFNDFLNYQIESAGLERPQDDTLSSATRIRYQRFSVFIVCV